MNFVKTNIQSTKGMQPSKFDALLSEFANPGDTLEFSESDLSRQMASNVAKRLMMLSSKKFHSGYNTVKRVVFVRMRLDNEIPSNDEPKEEVADDNGESGEEQSA